MFTELVFKLVTAIANIIEGMLDAFPMPDIVVSSMNKAAEYVWMWDGFLPVQDIFLGIYFVVSFEMAMLMFALVKFIIGFFRGYNPDL